ncbi:YkvA family protein [Ornithinibacillus halophilus]|uniref:DUF1232 domain-containing protein n=1 Tax=Ornithinibacillus halophilus TaxID=930117 RepID=A0A1M5GXD9_9BACI|nr:DUF1232 domain-containing protein [Ornithinibacillus halophilus]SHG08409.1 Protein of unknown function [Ornithinibacillus halophilus]
MRWLKRIGFLLKFHKSIPFLWGFFRSKEVNLKKKVLFIFIMLGYIAFPMDLIPDYLIGIGIVDDITIAIFILQLMVKVAPESLKEKYDF